MGNLGDPTPQQERSKVEDDMSALQVDRPTLTINSTNPSKLAEYERILGRPVAGTKLAVPEMQMESEFAKPVKEHRDGGDPFDNYPYKAAAAELASNKAKAAFNLFNGPVLIEDTWISLHGLRGEPGPFYSQWGNSTYNQDLCNRVHLLPPLTGEEVNDRATAIVTLAIWKGDPDCPPDVYQGVVAGRIAKAPRGENGFGWDSIFIPLADDGSPAFCHVDPVTGDVLVDVDGAPVGKTYAEMTPEEKDSISMRARALHAFMQRSPGFGSGAVDL
jgi:XTP/dITP diphosphohydrolase